MANSYSQIDLHIVFAVKYRESLILPEFRDELFRYIHGIIEGKNQKSLAVNGTADHVHVFAGVTPTVSIPDFVRDIKSDSSLFVNSKGLSVKKFRWQNGYGVFSISHSHRDRVIKYIMNQERHHAEKSFRREYINLLNKTEVPYNEKYLFEFLFP